MYRADFNTLTFDDYGLDGLQKHDALQERLELIDELKQAEYNKGLNDAWELVRKINNMQFKEFIKVFERTGYDGREVKMNLIDELTPQEALAKLKAYEEAQKIEVGDVVTNENHEVEILVTEIDDYERTFNGIKVTPTDELGNLGGVYTVMLMCKFKKTGKHIDIKSILEQIGD